MNIKKILALALTLATVTSFAGCKDKDPKKVLISQADDAVTDREHIYNLDSLRFTLYIDASGKRYLEDGDGNKIYENEDGKFIDEDGNEITDYNDFSDKSNNGNNANRDNLVPNNDDMDAGHQEPQANWADEKKAHGGANGGGGGDSNGGGVYYSYDRKIEHYNPQTGSSSLTVNTSFDLPLRTKDGLDFKGVVHIDAIFDNITGSSATCTISGRIEYNTDEFVEYCKSIFEVEQEDGVEDDIEIPEIDYKDLMRDTVVNCAIGVMGDTITNGEPCTFDVDPENGNDFKVTFTSNYTPDNLWYLIINNYSMSVEME